MAFPASAADLEVCIAYGANLASDLTTLTYSPNLAATLVQPRVLITRGRIGGAARTQPTTIDLGLKNPNGVFSPRNITGPNYGRLRRNTPIRVRLDPGTGMVTRAIGYLPDWPTRWTGPDMDDHIPMQASGALRRLGVSREPKSALHRTVMAQNPKAYWRLEDASSATTAASAVPGGSVMFASGGTVKFGAVSDLPGATTAPDLSVGALAGSVNGLSSTSWHLQFAVKSGLFPGPGSSISFMRVYTNDQSVNRVQFLVPIVGSDLFQVYVDNGAGGPVATLTYTTPSGTWADQWHHIGLSAAQSGGIVTFKLYVDGQQRDTSAPTTTLSAPIVAYLNPFWDWNATKLQSIAHLEFGDGPLVSAADYSNAIFAYSGEWASTRFLRLCTEEGVATDATAGPLGESMGFQAPGNIVDVLRVCEDSNAGVMVERRTGLLGLDQRRSRYNRSVAMTVNYLTQIAALEPDDGDRDLHNYVTVNRIGGSVGSTVERGGPLGTDRSTGVDRYPDTLSRSLGTDDQALHHAGWLSMMGTVDEPRYTVGINLRAHPELVTQWLACDISSRILINNPPAIQVGPAPLDLIIEGYQELLDGVEWYVTIHAMPYRPYEVLQIENGTGNRSRLAAGVSTTGLAYGATATSLSVTSASARWIDSATYPTKFPITIECAGEVMTCTSITGTGLTQTFAVTRGLHGVTKPLPINSPVQIWRPACIAL